MGFYKKSGGGILIDGEVPSEKMNLKSFLMNALISTSAPTNMHYGCAVEYHGELHVLGGNFETKHYKWNGEKWTSVSTLPYSSQYSRAVVYNDEIHLLGGSSNLTKHYKWNGTSWTSASSLPYSFRGGGAGVMNNELHIFGCVDSDYQKMHYKWNGTSWVSSTVLPDIVTYNGACEADNKIYTICGTTSPKLIAWNGSEWQTIASYPQNASNARIVYNGTNIYGMGGGTSAAMQVNVFKWNGSAWETMDDLPNIITSVGLVGTCNNKIFAFFSSASGSMYELCKKVYGEV